MAEAPAIGRLWRGRALPANAELYQEHLRLATLPELKALEGFERAYVLRRSEAIDVEFVVLTIWASEASVRGFAGADPEAGVVPLAARRVLHSFDERARHYEVALSEAS